jgi:hypothetical protein
VEEGFFSRIKKSKICPFDKLRAGSELSRRIENSKLINSGRGVGDLEPPDRVRGKLLNRRKALVGLNGLNAGASRGALIGLAEKQPWC